MRHCDAARILRSALVETRDGYTYVYFAQLPMRGRREDGSHFNENRRRYLLRRDAAEREGAVDRSTAWAAIEVGWESMAGKNPWRKRHVFGAYWCYRAPTDQIYPRF